MRPIHRLDYRLAMTVHAVALAMHTAAITVATGNRGRQADGDQQGKQ
jgi:hypothetical protein